ncbi:MAG: hypothetical protein IT162_03120 [Bryobacterales bacterium]|nr:hypothetical protein [Bryobacterales bacterium]
MADSWLDSLQRWVRVLGAGFTEGPRPGATGPLRDELLWLDAPAPAERTMAAAPPESAG